MTLTVVLAATNAFERLVVLANLSALLAYLGCAAAALQLRRRNVQTGGEPFRIPGGPIVPVLAMLTVTGLLSSITLDEWRAFVIALAAVTAIYFGTRRSRAARAAAPALP